MKNYWRQFKWFVHTRFDMREDRTDSILVVDSIKKGVEFKGTNLWILIFAILVASLGLNVNSTAVIIGAMLISPLMGPIMGVGLGLGINDFELIKKSAKNLLIATIIAMITSTCYFLITPLDLAQSELLSRTTPTTYDVLIAFFGGMAGIVALGSKEKGNVLPGVAIATALMPPLCTAGFGLATGNINYFLGAIYLYFLNSVFISFATLLGVRILKIPKKVFLDIDREKRVARYVFAILVVTLIPSVIIGFSLISKSYFETRANNFISQELNFQRTQVLSKTIAYHNTEPVIEVFIAGDSVSKQMEENAKSRLPDYGLSNATLIIKQGFGNATTDVSALKNLVLEDFYKKNEVQLQKQQSKIEILEQNLYYYERLNQLSKEIIPEVKVVFPYISHLSFAYAYPVDILSGRQDTVTLAVVRNDKKISAAEKEKINQWIKARTKAKKLQLIIE